MALIECVVREVHHLIEDAVRDRLRYTICKTARNALLFVSVDKIAALLLHDGLLLLGHRASDQVAPAHAVAAEIPHDLHDLLLIDNAAVGRLENRPHLLAVVSDSLGVFLAPDILGDEFHRARPVERDARYDILEAARLQLLHEILHAGAFKLEHALAPAAADHVHDRGVIVVDFGKVQRDRSVLIYKIYSVIDDRQRAKTEEVHLEQAKLFERSHRVLGRDRAVLSSR